LKQANQNSLILGDELCSGTESTSALSIFTAGLESLHAIEASFIFATHFHEITRYEEIAVLDKLRMYHMAVIYNKAKKQLIYDRKLKEGPGESMYGLEVCKSLDLPYDFLERAHSLRQKYSGNTSVLLNSSSHFNNKKLRGKCEICKKEAGVEVHHLQHQKNAVNGIIDKYFNKDHPANLINICENCHIKIHKGGTEHKIVKTSDGYNIIKL
jgi:DNA mismatch repair protein MutS